VSFAPGGVLVRTAAAVKAYWPQWDSFNTHSQGTKYKSGKGPEPPAPARHQRLSDDASPLVIMTSSPGRREAEAER
jgi:hypothetical protein